MATVITHAVTALTLGSLYPGRRLTWKFWAVSAACAILPDADVFGFAFGVPYEAFWGHRGFTHSLAFAAIVSAAVVLGFSGQLERGTPKRFRLFVYFFLVTASHGLLDALTDGGLGVALFSPFDTTRYFLPWRPIPASPIGAGFFSKWGFEVLRTEAIQVWTICLGVWLAQHFVRRSAVGRDK
jgi:inner membrane protein